MTRVLKGKERRHLIDHIAIGRAQFELEYDGLPIVPFDRDYVIWEIPADYRDEDRQITINVSDALVAEAQRKLDYWKRAVLETESAAERAERERLNARHREHWST